MTPATPKRVGETIHARCKSRTAIFLVHMSIFAALLISLYVGSYVIWSRVSLWRCQKYGLENSFWYLPEATAEQDDIEVMIGDFYYPLNWLDVEILNGPGHSAPPTRDISKLNRPEDWLAARGNDRVAQVAADYGRAGE